MKYLKKLKLAIGNTLYRPVNFFAIRDSKIALLLVCIYGVAIKSFRRLRLFPVEWVDENKKEIKKTLEQEQLGCSYGPRVIGGDQRVEQVQLQAVNLYHFENAQVSVLSSSILLDKKIIIERVKGVDVNRCNYSSGHVLGHGQKSALVRNLETEHLEQGIFLGGNGSSNYYHWMIELLPKLKYLNEIDKQGYDGFPLLVSEDVDYIKTFHEALNYIVKDRSVVKLSKYKAYRIRKLVYINAPNNLPFNLRKNESMRVSDFLTRISSINFLRNQLSIDPPSHPRERSRIFLSRHNERRNYNEEEIFEIFRQRGFQKVSMEALSLKEQISLFSNAEVIAGPTGAAWTNLIFCREGAKCLCWMVDGYGEFSAFSNLAKIVGADMQYVILKSKIKSTRELYYKSYSVDANKIRQGLGALLGEVD